MRPIYDDYMGGGGMTMGGGMRGSNLFKYFNPQAQTGGIKPPVMMGQQMPLMQQQPDPVSQMPMQSWGQTKQNWGIGQQDGGPTTGTEQPQGLLGA